MFPLFKKKETPTYNSSGDEVEIIPETMHREDVGFAYEAILSDDELNPHEAVSLLPQVFFPMTIELLDGYSQYGSALKDFVKQFWQGFYDKLVSSASIAEVQELSQRFCTKLGELSQSGWFSLQITPSQSYPNAISFIYHKDLTQSGITLWQAYWAAFIKQPTEKNASTLQNRLIKSLTVLQETEKLTHQDAKFIYNEFSIKTTLCLDYVKLTEQQLTKISQSVYHVKKSIRNADDAELSSAHLSVESHAQNLYRYGKMLLEKKIVLSYKEAINVIANKIDKMQEIGQISSVQSLIIARRVLALYHQASSSLSNDHSVEITRPDSPRPSSSSPSTYNAWASNPWEYDLARGTHSSDTGQNFSPAFDVAYLRSLPHEELYRILATLPLHQRDEIETQIAIQQSLSF